MKDVTKVEKPFYKKWWFIVIAVLFVLGAIGSLGEEEQLTDEVEATQKKTESKESKEKKAEVEAKKKAEAEAKKKEDAEAKAKAAEEKLAAEKEHYISVIQPQVNKVMADYDKGWSEIWQPTFAGLGETVDIYTAYDNMKSLESYYNSLSQEITLINDENLSKENKKLLSDFKKALNTAAIGRGMAAKNAKKIFDKGTFSPSEIDSLKTDVQFADSSMLDGIVSLTSLEMGLGVERK